MNLPRDFAKQNDEAILVLLLLLLNWDTSLKETDCSCREKYLIMEMVCAAWKKKVDFLFVLVLCSQSRQSSIRFPTSSNRTLQYTIQGGSGLGRQLADALSILHKLPSAKLQELLPDTYWKKVFCGVMTRYSVSLTS